MPITDTQFEALLRRKDAQVAELVGRDVRGPESTDTVREALEAHSVAIERAYAKTAALVPDEREAAVREPARTWVNDYHVRVGEFVLPASLLLSSLLRNERGAALVAEIASASPELAEALLSHLRHS